MQFELRSMMRTSTLCCLPNVHQNVVEGQFILDAIGWVIALVGTRVRRVCVWERQGAHQILDQSPLIRSRAL